jgi:hypothetical protein
MACHDLGFGTRTSTRDANTEKLACACKSDLTRDGATLAI